jgi:type IV secretion system protein VirB9
MKKLSFCLLLCSTSLPALALETPASSQPNPHMRVVPYVPDDVFPVTTMVGRPLTIDFGNDIRVKDFTPGKTNGPIGLPEGKNPGEAPPAVHTLPIVGYEPGTTNLAVITLLPDNYSERTYTFLVKVLPETKDGDSNPDLVYNLRFTYKLQEQQERQAAQQVVQHQAALTWKEKKAAADQAKAEARLATDIFYPGCRGPASDSLHLIRNFKYLAIGDASIVPYEASDNCRITAFRFPGNVNQPTVYIADGGPWCDLSKSPPESWLHSPERHAPTDTKDDMLIVHQTAEHYRFRLGKLVADSSNCGFDAVGYNPGTGTTSPDVIRELRQAKE